MTVKQAMSVMVADDEPHVRGVMAGLVAALGGRVVAEAQDGLEAAEAFERLRPEVAILDINMPRLRGHDALARILALEPGARVVMMTAEDTVDSVQECLDRGARHYVLKGGPAEELYALFSAIWREFEDERAAQAAP